ncbi:hypothetical protein D3C83_01090 [compost metagenome]
MIARRLLVVPHARQRDHARRVPLRGGRDQVVRHVARARLHQREVDAVAVHVRDQVVGVVDRGLRVVALVEIGIPRAERDRILHRPDVLAQIPERRKAVNMDVGVDDHAAPGKWIRNGSIQFYSARAGGGRTGSQGRRQKAA